jgi:hypothetical protein
MHDIKMIFGKDGGKPVKGKLLQQPCSMTEQNVPHTPLSTPQSNDGLLRNSFTLILVSTTLLND